MSRDEIVQRIAAALGTVADFSGEVMLLDWSKSTAKDGPKIKLMLSDDEAIAPFEAATIRKGKQAGQLYHVFAIRIDEVQPPKSEVRIVGPDASGELARVLDKLVPEQYKRPVNELARDLMVNGYFRNPNLWRAMEAAKIYTAEEHKLYVRTLPCVGPKHATHIACDGEVCGHHARSASLPSGGTKSSNPVKVPHWYCVPLCHAHHMGWVHASNSTSAVRADHEKLTERAVGITADQMKAKAKEAMGIASLADVTIALLTEFERSIGLGGASSFRSLTHNPK